MESNQATNRPVKALFDAYDDDVYDDAYRASDYYDDDDDTVEYSEQFLDEDWDYEAERDNES
jgi:hypothetical protein